MPHQLKVMQFLPELNSGGVERGTLEINRALTKAGHTSIVVSAGGRLVPQLCREGGEHIDMNIGRKLPTTLSLVPAVRRLIENYRPDIMHLRSRLPAWVAWLARQSLPADQRPRLVTTVHGLYSVNAYSKVMTRGEAVIAVSETVRDYLLKNYPDLPPERIHLIHRGVDEELFVPGHQVSDAFVNHLLAPWPQARGRTLVTFPARMTRWKGHLSLVRMLKDLDGQPDIQVLIVGDIRWNKKSFFRQLQRAARAAGVLDRLSFLGHRGDIRDIYAASSLVLQLSKRPEAFGRVAAEALSMGVPVVGWSHGGIGEILARCFPAGAVPPDNFAVLAARIRDILDRNIQVETTDAFPLRQMQQKTLAIYQSLTGGTGLKSPEEEGESKISATTR